MSFGSLINRQNRTPERAAAAPRKRPAPGNSPEPESANAHPIGAPSSSFSAIKVDTPLGTVHRPATDQASEARPLDPETRSFMEARFQHDFSRISVRSSPEAERMDAQAYTKGNELVFATGLYAPETAHGKWLLAHELAHAIQQTGTNRFDAPSKAALEGEASMAAQQAVSARSAEVQYRAPAGQPQAQSKGATPSFKWKTGSDVILNKAAEDDVKLNGALFSGQDQAHVNVSTQHRLSYDENHTAPEDAFRWQHLKDIVDGGHIDVAGVPAGQKFKVKEAQGNGKTTDTTKSIDEIKLDVGDLSVTGITLVRESMQLGIQNTEEQAAGAAAAQVTGPVSASASRDQIFYDKDNPSALSHELFGHAWLALKGVPFLHPKSGSAKEQTMGKLSGRHLVTDPFGQAYSGSVKDYIDKFINPRQEERTSTQGKKIVPASPTQDVSQQQFRDGLAGFIVEAKTGLTMTGGKSNYTDKLVQQLRIVSDNYNVLLSASDRTLIVDFLGGKWFGKLTAGQQEAFRDLLDDFMHRKGWSNELASALQNKVGLPRAAKIFQAQPITGASPGGLQLSNPNP